MRELRQKAGEEHRHLWIPEVAHETLPERDRRTRRSRAAAADSAGPPTDRGPKGLHTQQDEVSGAEQPERNEGRLGGNQQRREPGARRERPRALTDADADRGGETAEPPAQERVADREGRVLSRRDDHERGDTEEGGEVRD